MCENHENAEQDISNHQNKMAKEHPAHNLILMLKMLIRTFDQHH